MPRQEHILSIFVASPSDVYDERVRLEEIRSGQSLTREAESVVRNLLDDSHAESNGT